MEFMTSFLNWNDYECLYWIVMITQLHGFAHVQLEKNKNIYTPTIIYIPHTLVLATALTIYFYYAVINYLINEYLAKDLPIQVKITTGILFFLTPTSYLLPILERFLYRKQMCFILNNLSKISEKLDVGIESAEFFKYLLIFIFLFGILIYLIIKISMTIYHLVFFILPTFSLLIAFQFGFFVLTTGSVFERMAIIMKSFDNFNRFNKGNSKKMVWKFLILLYDICTKDVIELRKRNIIGYPTKNNIPNRIPMK